MGNGAPRGDRGRPLQTMDAGSTGLGFQTRSDSAPDLLKNLLPALGIIGCASPGGELESSLGPTKDRKSKSKSLV